MRYCVALLLLPLTCSAGGLAWSDRPSGTRAIRACSFDGSNVRNLYSAATDPRGVIIDSASERVYFCDRFTSTATSGEINSVPLAGGTRQQHATLLNRPADLRFDPGSRVLYWAEENGGLIRKASLPSAGGTLSPQNLFSGLANPYYLDFDLVASKLYWGTSGNLLQSGPITGGTRDPDVYSAGLNMRGVCVDSAAGLIYWVERDARVIRRRAISGGPILDLYTGLDTPHGLVLDLPARKLYWVDTGTGGVGGFNARGVSRGDLDGSSVGAAEIIVPGTASNQPWDLDLDPRTMTYSEWVGRFFRLDASPESKLSDADPDSDGISNFGEYAFGGAPQVASASPLARLVVVTTNATAYPAIQFPRRSGSSDLRFTVQVSADLQTWNDNSSGLFTVEVDLGPANLEGMQMVTVRSVTALDAVPQQFLRVKAETP